MVTGLAWEALASPVGEMYVACSPEGLAGVSFGPPRGRQPVPGAGPGPARALAVEARRQLAGYFSGRLREFRVPLDWSWASPLQQQVLSALLEAAGYGQTVSYGELARRAGIAGAVQAGSQPPARMAGRVLGANRCPVIIPCHRVVAGSGLGGYSGGTGVEVKRWLLTFEGALPPTLDWDPAGPA